MTRHLVIGLALAVALGGPWLWRELRAPTTPAAVESPSASTPHAGAGPTRAPRPGEPATPSSSPSVEAGASTEPLGGVRGWSRAPAPADGPDPFAPVITIRTEADTREGLTP